MTGEVALDYGKGLCTVDAPKAQGACGFLAKAGPIALRDLGINATNAYAAILAVPLDDLPLATSRKVLIQVTTAARPTGWKTKDADFLAEDGKTTVRASRSSTPASPPGESPAPRSPSPSRTPPSPRPPASTPPATPPRSSRSSGREGSSASRLPPQTMYLLLE